jgi:hypothetical protein
MVHVRLGLLSRLPASQTHSTLMSSIHLLTAQPRWPAVARSAPRASGSMEVSSDDDAMLITRGFDGQSNIEMGEVQRQTQRGKSGIQKMVDRQRE